MEFAITTMRVLIFVAFGFLFGARYGRSDVTESVKAFDQRLRVVEGKLFGEVIYEAEQQSEVRSFAGRLRAVEIKTEGSK